MNAIETAGHNVALAESAANTAADQLAAAHHHADGIRGRHNALGAERDAIAAARRAGGDVDGARLAVIQLDLEGLDSLLADASAAVAARQNEADTARAAVAAARQQLDLVKDTELIAKLKPHADKLGELLLATLTEIEAAGKRLQRSRPEWYPTGRLADTLHRLDLLASGIPGARR
jgi:hypothetical protein